MNITYNEKNRVFAIETENAGYYIAVVDGDNFLTHVHYGKKICIDDNLPHLLRIDEYPHTPSRNNRDRISFYDSTRWEYPCGGIGDFRESALNVTNCLGQNAVNLSYDSHKITRGKPSLEGLPATWGSEDDCMTLEIKCVDKVLNLEVFLSYSIFEGIDAVARSARICNTGNTFVKLEKVYSASLDMDNKGYDLITLHGSWARETRAAESIGFRRAWMKFIATNMPHREPMGLNDCAKFSRRVAVAGSPIARMYGFALVSRKLSPQVRMK